MKISRKEFALFFHEVEDQGDCTEAVRRERIRYLRSAIGRIHELLLRIEPHNGLKVLEIGASPFFASQALIRFLRLSPDQLILIDGSGVCDKGIRKLPKELMGQTYECHVFNAERLEFPFAAESFDLVLCQDVIEHLLFDPLFMIRESNRVLKKGGRLLISTGPAVFSWRIALRHLFNLNVEMGYDVVGKNPYLRHHRLFSLRELKQMVSLNGFAIMNAFAKSHWYRVDPTTDWKTRLAKRTVYLLESATRLLSFFLPFLREKAGSQIWVQANKEFLREKILYPPTLDMHSDFQ